MTIKEQIQLIVKSNIECEDNGCWCHVCEAVSQEFHMKHELECPIGQLQEILDTFDNRSE